MIQGVARATISHAELAKIIEQKRAVEHVSVLEANLNPDFLTKLEAEKAKSDNTAQPDVPLVFPVEA